VLNLFVTLRYRFPNLVVGNITRESVRRALANGISADQIISFLITHAHPQMRRNVSVSVTLCRDRLTKYPMGCVGLQNPLLPVTVQDQIRLWELERNRVKSQEGLYSRIYMQQLELDHLFVQDTFTRPSHLRPITSSCWRTPSSCTLSCGKARRRGAFSGVWMVMQGSGNSLRGGQRVDSKIVYSMTGAAVEGGRHLGR
jgi:hypothetical protein